MRTFKLGLALPILAWAGAAHAANVVSNGGFETGNFTGWTASTSNAATGSCDTAWNVSSSGGGTGCLSAANPSGSTYAAYTSFDGDGPQTTTLAQTVSLAAGITSAILGWSDSYQFSYNSSTLRSLDINIVGASGTTNLYHQTFATNATQSSFVAHTLDVTSALSAYGGQSVSLQFIANVPQSFTGPAGYGLDNVSLDVAAAVPEPATWGMMVIGFGAVGFSLRRRKTSVAHA